MLQAKDQGMTSKEYVYIWMNPDIPTQNLFNILTSSEFWDNDDDAKDAFKSLLVVSDFRPYYVFLCQSNLLPPCFTSY